MAINDLETIKSEIKETFGLHLSVDTDKEIEESFRGLSSGLLEKNIGKIIKEITRIFNMSFGSVGLKYVV
ncbi:MAG: hypothetical protein HRU19_22380 [Pseudobacteriovorax sp.]|nr:hypothetical protein [Pseudobacteriovorax sp.]